MCLTASVNMTNPLSVIQQQRVGPNKFWAERGEQEADRAKVHFISFEIFVVDIILKQRRHHQLTIRDPT